MVKSRKVSLFLIAVYLFTIFGFHNVYAEEPVFEAIYDNFDYPDGTKVIPGWKFSNNQNKLGDVIEAKDNQLMVTTSSTEGVIILERRLPVPFTGNKAIFQFTVNIVKDAGFNNMFPGLGSNGGPGTTHLQQTTGGTLTSQVAAGQGGNKTFDMRLLEGNTYDFGFIIDLENKSQDIYIRNNSTGIIDSITSGFKTADYNNIEFIKFWLRNSGSEVGEYYFDNFSFEEANQETLRQFYLKFINPEDPNDPGDPDDVRIDRLEDIKAAIGNAIVVSAGSTYTFINGSRTKIDEANDEVMPIMENNEILVPAKFIADGLAADFAWNANTVTINKADIEVIFTVNSNQYTVNSQVYNSNAPVRIISENPFIPLRAISGALGKKMYWDGQFLYGISDEENLLDPVEDQAIIHKLVRTFGLHVSPNGNDSNPGTYGQPFRTLEKARDFLSVMKAGDGLPEGGMTVYIAGGEYRFFDSFTLEKDNSGSAAAPITYCSVPGDEVRFTGAFNIPADQFVAVTDENILDRFYESVRDRVLQVDLRALGLNDYGSIKRANVFLREEPDTVGLILDNIPQTLARWPNEGYVKTGDVSIGTTTTTVNYIENAPERWSEAEEPWAQGFWQYEWRDDSLPIKGINTNNKAFIMDNTTDGFKKGQPYYVFNLLEEIDQPGEWYLDRTTGILYYYPTTELNNNKLQLSLFDKPMIVMTHTANINIRGITFEASTSAGITMNYASDNQISNCTFRNLGSQAVNIRNASYTGVIDCDIYDIGKGGVYIRGGDRPTLTYGHNYVENNYFTRFSRSVKTYTPAVLLDGVGNRITHNIIHDGPHEGIGVNGNDQLIEYNELYDLCKETGDSGAIYAGRDWTQRGITIRNNIFHTMRGNEELGLHDVFAIYFDDMLSGGIVESNLFFDIDTPVNIHGGRNFTIDSNIVANSDKSIRLVAYAISQTTELEARYAAMPVTSDLWKNKYPNIDNILEDEPRLPKYNVITNTLIYNSGDLIIQEPALPSGTFEYNIKFNEDPGFVDAANNIFKMEDGFDGSGFGFNNFRSIDYDTVGMYVSNNRKSMPQLSEFDLVSPKNGELNIEGGGFTMRWVPSLGATKYQVLVATDENFTNIVFEGETKNNSIFVSDLEYDTTSYYWKVKAISGSILYPDTQENSGGVYRFTTAESQEVVYTELISTIEQAVAFSQETVAGTEPGEYPAQVKADLLTAIGEAELILNASGVTQIDINNAIADLKDAVATLRGSVIIGTADLGTLIRDSTNWIAAQQSFLEFEDNKLTFTPEAGSLMVAAYNEMVPKYMTWKMKATFDFGDGTKWQGFGLRASEPQRVGWTSYASYLIIIKENQFELQNFHDGSNRFVVPAVTNDGIIEAGKEYDIELGALDVKDGVRLILKVEGQTIFDVIDAGLGNNRFINDPGYFVIYSSQGYSFRLAAAGEESVITSIEPMREEVKIADLNDDGERGLHDLAFIAGRYLGKQRVKTELL